MQGARCCRDELGRVVLGDVIIGIDGKDIKLQRDLFEILDERRPGDKISLEILRNGQKLSVQIELGGRQLSGTE
jgi:S1-C subfamily serine protease